MVHEWKKIVRRNILYSYIINKSLKFSCSWEIQSALREKSFFKPFSVFQFKSIPFRRCIKSFLLGEPCEWSHTDVTECTSRSLSMWGEGVSMHDSSKPDLSAKYVGLTTALHWFFNQLRFPRTLVFLLPPLPFVTLKCQSLPDLQSLFQLLSCSNSESIFHIINQWL